jgi:mRNA interferase RelE/StbE
LEINPIPTDAKRLQGYASPTFRIRIGKYRVLYEIRESEILIIIVKIDKRERVYN